LIVFFHFEGTIESLQKDHHRTLNRRWFCIKNGADFQLRFITASKPARIQHL